MRLDTILRIAAKLFIPFIFVFALYVQFHGDFGPGGGFQAGVIIAAGVVLYAIIYGLNAAQRAVPKGLVEFLVPLGVLIYAGVGVWSLLIGDNYLEYNNLSHGNQPHGQERGVFWVEIGVLVTVASTMIAIFYLFAGRGRQ
jgi:multicomponent Na+:H+ antiporter subunit B